MRLSVAREHAPDILHLSADVVVLCVLLYPNTMAAQELFVLASLVIILETYFCQEVQLNCRVVLGAPTRMVLPLPRKSEVLLLLIFSFPQALSSTLEQPIPIFSVNLRFTMFSMVVNHV